MSSWRPNSETSSAVRRRAVTFLVFTLSPFLRRVADSSESKPQLVLGQRPTSGQVVDPEASGAGGWSRLEDAAPHKIADTGPGQQIFMGEDGSSSIAPGHRGLPDPAPLLRHPPVP